MTGSSGLYEIESFESVSSVSARENDTELTPAMLGPNLSSGEMLELLGIAPRLKILLCRTCLQTVVCHNTLLFEQTESTGMNNCCLSDEVVTCLVTGSAVE